MLRLAMACKHSSTSVEHAPRTVLVIADARIPGARRIARFTDTVGSAAASPCVTVHVRLAHRKKVVADGVLIMRPHSVVLRGIHDAVFTLYGHVSTNTR